MRKLEKAGHRVEEVAGPKGAEPLNEWQNTLMHGEGRSSYLAEHARGRDSLHPGVLGVVDNRLGISFDDMREAYDRIAALRPKNEAELLEIKGIGPAIAERHGEAILEIVTQLSP